MQSNRDPLGGGPMIYPGARVYIAIADGQGELVAGSIEFFLAGPEFDEVHGLHSVVRGTWHAVQAQGKGSNDLAGRSGDWTVGVPNPCLFRDHPELSAR